MRTRIEREKITVKYMIRLYCRRHHHPQAYLCDDCDELRQYALARVDKCIFGENKPVCAECRVHCYKKDMRERVREIMRYSGPRMLLHHPVLAIRHMIDSLDTSRT